MKRSSSTPLLWLAVCLASLPSLRASTPAVWELNSYRDFIAGRFSGLSLTRDGRLALAPKAETIFSSDQPVIWSAVQADGSIYAGTGHRGRLYRVDRSGNSQLIWTADQPEIFALALDARGILYAGTSPDGRIYRIENGKAVEYFNPQAKYIWALAFDRDGVLYAGTGDQGRIYRISGPGKGEVYYETGQAHVTCLAFDRENRLLAGSEPNGIIYRVSAKDKGFVLYDAGLPEIRSIVPGPDGAVYAAALGGSMSRRALGGVTSAAGVPSSVSVTTSATTVTVEAQQGPDLKPKPDTAKPAQFAQAATSTQAAAVVDVTGIEKSAIYRIAPDDTVDTLWSSKEENVYDILLSGSDVIFSTDGQGRIYRLADRKSTLLTQTNEGEATRLLATASGLVAATGDMGKLYRLTSQPNLSGSFESPVHDAGGVARWGRLSWRGESLEKGRLVFRTRTGNSVRPDKTWSDWSEPLTDPGGSLMRSPNARYIQWKAELSGPAAGPGPVLDSVALAYLPQNNPPVARAITVTTQAPGQPGAAQKAAATAVQPTAAYSITVTDTGEAPQTSAGTPTQNLQRASAEQMQITWQAEDPDGDRLSYALYFRGEDEREWKLLRANLTENTYSIDADSLADGKYLFRVIASDSPVNPPGSARDAEFVSAPTLVDHTPPVVTAGAPTRSGARLEVTFDAADAASPLRRAEYSLDAAPWVPVDPVDGIIDSPRERFVIRIDSLAPGEHLLVFRAVDSANNTGLAKVVVR